MKLRRITIDNFRSIERLELNLETDALALFGDNGQGKSSVLYALQVLFHGKCPVTMGSRTTLDSLIYDGAPSAKVTAWLDTWQVSLTLKRKGANEFEVLDTETGEIPDELQSREGFWEHVGINPKHAAVAMLPDQYLCSKDLGGILADLLAGDVSAEAVLDLAGEHREWLDRYLKMHKMELTAASDLADLGKHVESARRERNKDLKFTKDHIQQLPPSGPVRDYKGRKRDIDELPAIRQQLDKLESQRAALLEERGRAAAATDVSPDELAAAQEAAQKAVEDHDRATQAFEAAREARDTLRQEESNSKASIDRMEADVREAEEALNALSDKDGKCPTCGRKYTDALRKKLLDPLQKRLAEAQSGLDAARGQTEALRGQVSESHTAYAQANDAVQVAQQRYQAAMKRATELETRAQAAADVRPVDDIDADIQGLDEKHARGKGLVEKLTTAKERDELKQEAERVEKDIAHLDWAVEAFRDGAIAKQLMSSGLDDFVSRCNAELAPMGYTMDVHVEGKNASVWLQCPAQGERPVHHCSDGQQKLAEFAVAVAFADTGAPVLLDNLNELDVTLRRAVLKRLRDVEQVSTVIVAGAWQQSRTDWQKVAGALSPVTVYWVEDGFARPAQEVGAA